jgi:hypothetical protein
MRKRSIGDEAKPARPGERGAVMVVVLLVMLGLLAVGMTGLWMTSGNLQIGAHTNLRNQALYVAEAGIEAVRADLNGANSRVTDDLLRGGKAVGYDNVPTGVDSNGQPNGIGAVYFYQDGTVLRDVAFPPAGFNRGAGSAPASATMGSYTVWIRNDTGELRQGRPLSDGNGIVVVRSRGVAADGRIEVVLQATLSPTGSGGGMARVCYAGKNACDDNSSTVSGIYLQ